MRSSWAGLIEQYIDHRGKLAVLHPLRIARRIVFRDCAKIGSKPVSPINRGIVFGRLFIVRRQNDYTAHVNRASPEGSQRRTFKVEHLARRRSDGLFRCQFAQGQLNHAGVRRVQLLQCDHLTAWIAGGISVVGVVMSHIQQRHHLVIAHRCLQKRRRIREIVAIHLNRASGFQALYFARGDPHRMRFRTKSGMQLFLSLLRGGEKNQQPSGTRHTAQLGSRVSHGNEAVLRSAHAANTTAPTTKCTVGKSGKTNAPFCSGPNEMTLSTLSLHISCAATPQSPHTTPSPPPRSYPAQPSPPPSA